MHIAHTMPISISVNNTVALESSDAARYACTADHAVGRKLEQWCENQDHKRAEEGWVPC